MTDETEITELNVYFQSKPTRTATIVKTRCGYQLTYWISANSFRVTNCKTRQEAKTLIEQSGVSQTFK